MITGAPLGSITQAEELYLESAPQIYMADYRGYYGDTTNGRHVSLSGTSTYPVYAIGCTTSVSFSDNLTTNEVRCDSVGSKDLIIKRNHLEVKFTLQSFLPFGILSALMNGGTVTTNLSEHTTVFSLGNINNAQYWRFYLPKVYDDVAGDYVSMTFHRCKIISSGELSMGYGTTWQLPITVWALADESLSAAERFATILRADFSAI